MGARTPRSAARALPGGELAVLLAIILGTLSSCDPWGRFDNPGDPKARSYQGFETVASPNLVRIASPASGAALSDTALTLTPVSGAVWYGLRIWPISAPTDSTPMFESRYESNVLEIPSNSGLEDGTTYRFQAGAGTASGAQAWAEAASFEVRWSPPAAAPAFGLAGGTYNADQSVTLTAATPGATIRYTTDGTAPGPGSSVYDPASPIAVSGHGATVTVAAVAVKFGMGSSAVASRSYSIKYPAAAPAFSPGGGTFANAPEVTLGSSTPGATIYYTLDGSDPSSSGTRLSSPSPVGPFAVAIDPLTRIRAIAEAPLFSRSAEGEETYSKVFAVGDTGPAGGFVFYDKGYYADGWRFMEAAPVDQSGKYPWASDATHIGTESAIGTGASNTAKILAALGSNAGAARLCAELSVGGYDDWFLPSIDELTQMITHWKGDYASYPWYWSSTEMTSGNAARVEYIDGTATFWDRTYNGFAVRAARAF